MHIDFTLDGGGDSSYWDFRNDCTLTRRKAYGPKTREGVFVWDLVAVFIKAFIIITYATVEHTWGFDYGFDSFGVANVPTSGFLDDFGDGLDVGFPHLVIIVAVPHDVPGCCPLSIAPRVIAKVTVHDARLK